MSHVTPAQAQDQLPEWTVVDGRLELSVLAKNFVQAIEFMNRLADLAETQNHHPDVDLRYNTIRLRVVSHDVGGLTDRDLTFAQAADTLIEQFGLKRQPTKISRTHLVVTSSNVDAVQEFWRAALNFTVAKHDPNLLVDRSDVLAPIRFQRDDDVVAVPATAPTLQLEVFVPQDHAEQRVQAVLEAGGILVDKTPTPPSWELADVDGNRVTIRLS